MRQISAGAYELGLQFAGPPTVVARQRYRLASILRLEAKMVEMWMLWAAPAASGCDVSTPAPVLDVWLIDAEGVPTDARLTYTVGRPTEVVLTRLDTNEFVATAAPEFIGAWSGGSRYAVGAVDPLAPRTEYRIDLIVDDTVASSATFTTGDGPAAPLDAHPIAAITNESWSRQKVSDGCSSGSGHVYTRTLGLDLALPTDLELGTLIAVSSPARPEDLEYLSPWAGGQTVAFSLYQVEGDASTRATRDLRSCLTPGLFSPSGEIAWGAEVCAATEGGGCATVRSPSVAAALGVTLALLVRRQRRGLRRR